MPAQISPEADKILRDSVPDRWKGCTSAIGAVQSYIAELEHELLARDIHPLDDVPTKEGLAYSDQ